MKKTLLFLAFSTAIISFVNAQTIPNADFENWTAGSPTGWTCPANVPPLSIYTVTQSTDHQSGNSSAKLQPTTYAGSPFPAILELNNGYGLYTTSKPSYLNGYIKSTLISSDSLIVYASFTSNLNTTSDAGGGDLTQTSIASWSPFHISLSYPPGFTPDSFTVGVAFFGSSSSSAYLDNLSFSNTPIGNELGNSMLSGIKNVTSNSSLHSTISPNPANENSQINFTLNSSSFVSIKIYDVAGRFVKTVLNENLASGNHQATFNANELHNGLYFYSISGEGFNETKKFVVNK